MMMRLGHFDHRRAAGEQRAHVVTDFRREQCAMLAINRRNATGQPREVVRGLAVIALFEDAGVKLP